MTKAFLGLTALVLWLLSLIDARHRGYLNGFHDGVKQSVAAIEANACNPKGAL